MTFAQILEAILGMAEEVVPIFIHNPKSQQIEGVVVTTVNGAIGLVNQVTAPAPTPVQQAAPTPINQTGAPIVLPTT